jgi:hypothetical protein
LRAALEDSSLNPPCCGRQRVAGSGLGWRRVWWKEGFLFGGRGRPTDTGGGRGGAGDRKEEERAQQENTGKGRGNGLEPLSAGPGADKEGRARGRAGCPGRRILGPNMRPEWVRADAFRQLCPSHWAVCSVRADAFERGMVVLHRHAGDALKK